MNRSQRGGLLGKDDIHDDAGLVQVGLGDGADDVR